MYCTDLAEYCVYHGTWRSWERESWANYSWRNIHCLTCFSNFGGPSPPEYRLERSIQADSGEQSGAEIEASSAFVHLGDLGAQMAPGYAY